MIRLDVHDGSARRSFTHDAITVRIGRGAECELVLPGDATVSRVHAVLVDGDGGLAVEDAGSRNGTFVNGRKIEQRCAVHASDRILIGNFVLVVRDAEEGEMETLAAAGTPARVQAETGLSAREIEVLRLVCAGDSDQQIAATLFISVKTVHSHLDRIRTKTGCRRRPEMLRYAIEHGIA